VLDDTTHPAADEIYERARARCATVYNTLNLLVEKHLLRTQILKEGTVVFDPNVNSHHHFIDDETGAIIDIPWDKRTVVGKENLEGFDIRDCQVIVRGKRKV
jgi:Fe2+ or Zn2+ uptake regulation protein